MNCMNRGLQFLAGLWKAGLVRNAVPCVGLVVFFGCFSFIIAPDPNVAPSPGQKIAEAPAKESTPTNALPTVVIDPGHGGVDEGTAYYGLAEKDLTLDVAQRLERILQSVRISTVLTRHDDQYVALPARVAVANQIQNAIFVSIHFNQSRSEPVDGIETYYADQKLPPAPDWTWVGFFNRPEEPALDNGENLAADVQASLASRMLIPNRGIKSKALYVVRHTRAPAILVEGGFISNRLENQMLRNDSYRERLATAVAAGIVTYIQTTHPATAVPRVASLDARACRSMGIE